MPKNQKNTVTTRKQIQTQKKIIENEVNLSDRKQEDRQTEREREREREPQEVQRDIPRFHWTGSNKREWSIKAEAGDKKEKKQYPRM